MGSIQNIEGWEVFDNDKPAIIKDSKKGWNNNFFREFADALKYAKSWLGEWDTLPENYQGEPYDYNGYGTMIEIRFNPGIQI